MLRLWFFNTSLYFEEVDNQKDLEKSIIFTILIVLHLQPHSGNFPYAQELCIIIIVGPCLEIK